MRQDLETDKEEATNVLKILHSTDHLYLLHFFLIDFERFTAQTEQIKLVLHAESVLSSNQTRDIYINYHIFNYTEILCACVSSLKSLMLLEKVF